MFGNLGFTELLFIFVIALIFFGPRKLPELGKSLGQTLGQFKRASEDFKRSWEEEVEIEKRRAGEPAVATAQATPAAPQIIPAPNTVSAAKADAVDDAVEDAEPVMSERDTSSAERTA
jgi:TatA/E family protein of Tat protein translocase